MTRLLLTISRKSYKLIDLP